MVKYTTNEHMNKITLTLTAIMGTVLFMYSCAKTAKGEDKEIWDLTKPTDGYVYYKNSKTITDKSDGSGHTDARLLTRFNSIAAAYLDTDGKVKAGSVFADGSLIVKDLYNKKDKLQGYAIMLKNSKSSNADKNGWVWAVFNEDGKVKHSVSKKGDGCMGCHAGGGNIDGSLMNVSFP